MPDIPLGYSLFDANITAAGADQSSATRLTGFTSIVTSVPLNSGVQIIPALHVTQIIFNAGAGPLNIYPQSGMALYPNSANAAVVVQPGHSIGVVVQDATHAYLIFNTSSFG
jgi:hypothetical protein